MHTPTVVGYRRRCWNGTVAHKDTIDIDHLPPQLMAHPMLNTSTVDPVIGGTANAERQQLFEALHAAGGNWSQAVLKLGVKRVTVWNGMRTMGSIISERSIVN